MEQVQKTGKGVVAVMQLPVAGVFGQVQRQRALWSEHAEKADLEAGRRVFVGPEGGKTGRSERQRGFLAEAHGLVLGAHGASPARLVGKRAFDPAHGLQEVEGPGLPGERGEQF